MSWVSNLFTTTEAPKFTPDLSHESTAFSVVQGYPMEEEQRYRVAQARQSTNMEEAEETRRPYWQVWLLAFQPARSRGDPYVVNAANFFFCCSVCLLVALEGPQATSLCILSTR